MVLRSPILTCVLIHLICAFPVFTVQIDSYLFIVTEPMGATVYLNGQLLEGSSPLLVRNLNPGTVQLRFEKEGYYTQDLKLQVPESQVAKASLISKEPIIYADGLPFVFGSEEATKEADTALRLKIGELVLSPGKEGLNTRPLFPKQRWLDGAKFALPLFLGLTGVLTVREIFSPRDSNFIIAPELAASGLIGGGLLVWTIVLETKRNRSMEEQKPDSESWESLGLTARLRFEAATEALLGGNFQIAQDRFNAIIRDYPDHPIMPHALFELGRTLFIQGNIQGAAKAYRQVAEEYPLPELHDRARKSLADCLINLGERESALEQLNLLTFNGSGLTREEVFLYRSFY